MKKQEVKGMLSLGPIFNEFRGYQPLCNPKQFYEYYTDTGFDVLIDTEVMQKYGIENSIFFGVTDRTNPENCPKHAFIAFGDAGDVFKGSVKYCSNISDFRIFDYETSSPSNDLIKCVTNTHRVISRWSCPDIDTHITIAAAESVDSDCVEVNVAADYLNNRHPNTTTFDFNVKVFEDSPNMRHAVIGGIVDETKATTPKPKSLFIDAPEPETEIADELYASRNVKVSKNAPKPIACCKSFEDLETHRTDGTTQPHCTYTPEATLGRSAFFNPNVGYGEFLGEFKTPDVFFLYRNYCR